MRLYSTIIAACAILLCPARECQAQFWKTTAGKQLSALEAAFTAEPRLVAQQRGSEPYYDVVVENICDGTVRRLATDWLQESVARFNNRLMLINAQIDFPDSPRSRLEIATFSDGNFPDAHSICKETIIQGIPRLERVQVTLKLIVASELGQNTLIVVGAGLSALGAAVNPWLGVAIGVVAASTKAYAAKTKEVTQQVLAAGGTIISAQTVAVGSRAPGKIRPTSPTIAEAHFVANEQEWFSLRRRPRSQLLQYDPNSDDPKQIIPNQIDLVTAYAKWDEMLRAARFDRLDWSQPREISTFCTSFRRQLLHSLQNDLLAVRLGLYAHFVLYKYQFSSNRDRANRGCLESAELTDLGEHRYIGVLSF